MLWLLISIMGLGMAEAGYGDAADGLPRPDERALHAWTNAVRMDPGAFEDAYGCPMANWPAEETQPRAPLGVDLRLVEAARVHSEDMAARGFFDHENPEGEDPFDRMAAAGYPMVVGGENIQQGASEARDAVLGWMCSSGHRGNILLPDFHDLGAGVAPAAFGAFWTQNFGSQAGVRSVPALAMGAHESRGAGTLLLLSVGASAAPAEVVVVVDGEVVAMELGSGRPAQGTWRVRVDPGDGCHLYWFEAEIEGENTRFPESGAYAFGVCGEGDVDDAEAQWASADTVEASLGGTTREALASPDCCKPDARAACKGGDLTGGASTLGLVWLGLAGLTRRRRVRV